MLIPYILMIALALIWGYQMVEIALTHFTGKGLMETLNPDIPPHDPDKPLYEAPHRAPHYRPLEPITYGVYSDQIITVPSDDQLAADVLYLPVVDLPVVDLPVVDMEAAQNVIEDSGTDVPPDIVVFDITDNMEAAQNVIEDSDTDVPSDIVVFDITDNINRHTDNINRH